MYGNNSVIGDKDNSFFANNLGNIKKGNLNRAINSSNPEKDYSE
jgi:hypothetical protein